MALKEYEWRGHTYRFEESDAPEGAVPVKGRAKPADKAAKAPADKSAKAAKKA